MQWSSQVPLFSSCLPLSVPFPYSVLIWCCQASSSYDDELQGVYSHFEDVKLEPNPAYGEGTASQAQNSVAMEENPAYQPAEHPLYEYVEGVPSSDVKMEEKPAYQSQKEEPEYV